MPADQDAAAPRPQSLMLSFFGIHALGRDVALASAGVIDAFARVQVSEEAVRSTLTRMVNRGLLARHRRGRRMYFGLTERATTVLTDGQDRIWRTGAVNREWDGSWTLVGFSLPEAWRRERHDLRSRLVWGGFAPLQSGLWTAPGEVDVAALVDGLDLEGHLRVFHGRAVAPTDAADLLAAFDVPAIAAGYGAFLDRWGGTAPGTPGTDDLARELLLHTDWLDLVRGDPHLPAEHLPADWPAEAAEQLFRTLAHRYQPGATAIAARILDRIELPPPA
ncbi:PaaX family transcriptional regulator C-terminal domain-containing protein [Streptomyces sp. CB02959]|uniref:PaaX family transcriptional regulator n=1 Tax=Streptomyces sp. CB02959 TaxID=2020330 RepID=UPI0021525CBD|nr:PaaX family transcriptional regulator C-terminal domain-containing protein [Streptomyces sp. CB02959]